MLYSPVGFAPQPLRHQTSRRELQGGRRSSRQDQDHVSQVRQPSQTQNRIQNYVSRNYVSSIRTLIGLCSPSTASRLLAISSTFPCRFRRMLAPHIASLCFPSCPPVLILLTSDCTSILCCAALKTTSRRRRQAGLKGGRWKRCRACALSVARPRDQDEAGSLRRELPTHRWRCLYTLADSPVGVTGVRCPVA
jgi:hypothetical protein